MLRPAPGASDGGCCTPSATNAAASLAAAVASTPWAEQVLVVMIRPLRAPSILLSPVRGSTPSIDARAHPNGLATLEQVPVNGTRQWVLVRSENVTNPVVLFVHGGPGTSQLTLMRRNTRALETSFTVVNWDQRRAGKSFAAGRDRASLNMAQFVDDVIALSSYLAQRFRQDRILLVGHSWGSAIGMLAVSRRPDLFAAYVGIGQASRVAESEEISYAWTLEQARMAGDRSSVKKLTDIGPPPYTGNWRSKFITERRLLGRYGGEYYGSRRGAFGVVLRNLLISREYTLVDRVNFFRGILQSVDAVFPELYRTDLFVEVPEVEIPVYFCLGRHDYEVPSILAARYFEALNAPRKQLVWFESSAHMPNTEEKDTFNEFMLDTVLPAVRETVGDRFSTRGGDSKRSGAST
jgi:pimeloyl-ACP methyl ester carboxylesterase